MDSRERETYRQHFLSALVTHDKQARARPDLLSLLMPPVFFLYDMPDMICVFERVFRLLFSYAIVMLTFFLLPCVSNVHHVQYMQSVFLEMLSLSWLVGCCESSLFSETIASITGLARICRFGVA